MNEMPSKITSRLSNYLNGHVMPVLHLDGRVSSIAQQTDLLRAQKSIPRHPWHFGAIIHVFFGFMEVEKISYTRVAVVLAL